MKKKEESSSEWNVDVTSWAKYGFGHEKTHGERALERENKHADHKCHSRADFLKALAENHKDLAVTDPSQESEIERESNSNDDPLYYAHFAPYRCVKCRAILTTTVELLNHCMTYADEKSKQMFVLFGVISTEIKKLYNEAVERQQEESYFEKEIKKSDLVIRCPVASPLGPFLMKRSLKVHLGSFPKLSSSSNDEVIGFNMKRNGEELSIYFEYAPVERKMDKIREIGEQETEERNLEYLTDVVRWNECHFPSVCEARTRPTRNGDKPTLESALNLQNGLTTQELIEACEKSIELFHVSGSTSSTYPPKNPRKPPTKTTHNASNDLPGPSTSTQNTNPDDSSENSVDSPEPSSSTQNTIKIVKKTVRVSKEKNKLVTDMMESFIRPAEARRSHAQMSYKV